MKYEMLDPLYQKYRSLRDSRTRQSVFNLGKISVASLEVLATVGTLGFALANKDNILQTIDRYDVYGALTALATIAGLGLVRRSIRHTYEEEKKKGERLENTLRYEVNRFLKECREDATLGLLDNYDRGQLQRGVDHGYIEFGEAREIRDLAKIGKIRRKRKRPYSNNGDSKTESGFLPPSDSFLPPSTKFTPPKQWKPKEED